MAFLKLPATSLAGVALLATRLVLAHETHHDDARPVPTGEPWSVGCLPGPFLDRRHPSCVVSAPAAASSLAAFYDDAAYPYNPKKNAPWTHRPYCPPDTQYCVHTNADFERVGVSLITLSSTGGKKNPDDAATAGDPLAHFETIFRPEFKPKRELKREMPVLPFAVRDLPGKGKGVVATSPIPRGTVLMVEHAAVVADSAFPMRVKRQLGRAILQTAMRRIAKNGGEQAILELSRSSPDAEGVPAAEDVMKTNSFTVDVGGRSMMALFPKIARINHACKPNAIIKFDQETLSMTVRPLRDIRPGEEISISYTTYGETFKNRQRTLLQKWGFECTCSLCSLSPEERAASDARRDSIADLGQEVIGKLNDADYAGAIKKHREMMNAIEDEGLAPHMGDYYEVMTRLYAATGDRKNAKKYARLAIKEFEAIGEEKVEELEAFVRAVG